MLNFIAIDCTRYSRLRESHFFGTWCRWLEDGSVCVVDVVGNLLIRRWHALSPSPMETLWRDSCSTSFSLTQVSEMRFNCRDSVKSLLLTSTWLRLRCDVGLEEGEYWNKNCLCYSIMYYYNCAQRYEQFLQVSWLDRVLILLGLAL